MQNKIRMGRNEPCWCGSGKKFKKCHWPDIEPAPHPIAGISYFDETELTQTLKKVMAIDFEKLDINDLKSSKNYIFKTLQNNVIPDVRDPDREDYMEYSYILETYILEKESDKEVTKYYKDLYKSVLKSENKFNYQLYKGHILVKIATRSLISDRNLDDIVSLLNQAQQEDIKFGYKNPSHRPAYKILSFLQPLLTFRDRLWPSDEKVRKQVGTRLMMVLHMNKAAIDIAFGPEAIKNDIEECLKNNKLLLNIMNENVDELLEIMELCDKKLIFYKSGMFLVGNIIEGVLYNISIKASIPEIENKEVNLERASIEKLARLLRRNAIIDAPTEYYCRFIQHYRDFIHPVRNLKHEYILNHNFNKMFLFFLILLLGDLQKASETISNINPN